MNLLFLSYNNYYNRIAKQESSLDDYKDATIYTDEEGEDQYKYHTYSNVNFHEGDQIDTEIVINWNLPWIPDYLICYTGSWSDPTLEHRWFVTNSVRTRKGQYKFTLHRDVIIDNYQDILSSDTFIEKATVDSENPLIFNNENMTYNQIKVKEELITDPSNTQWIVGYLTNGGTTSRPGISGEFGFSLKADIDLHDTKSTDWAYYQYINSGFREIASVDKVSYTLAHQESGWWTHGSIYDTWYRTYSFYRTASGTLGYGVEKDEDVPFGFIISKSHMNTFKDNWGYLSGYNFDTVKSDIITDDGYLTDTQVRELLSYKGKKILFSDGIFVINIDNNGYKSGSAVLNNKYGEVTNKNYFNRLNDMVKSKVEALGESTANWFTDINVNYSYRDHTISLAAATLSDGVNYEYTIPSGARPLQDAPYTMFAIPYFKYKDAGNYYNIIKGGARVSQACEADIMMTWAQNIVKRAGYAGSGATGYLLDLQILPYCPFIEEYQDTTMSSNGDISLYIPTDYILDIDYSLLYEKGKEKTAANAHGVVFFPKKSSFSKRIPGFLRPKETVYNAIPVSDYFPYDDVKVRNETEFIRLVSPNYSGAFEFTPVKNGGITAFNIDCAYKPFTPYIQVQPEFDYVYGSDFNDARGLICGGDFSLPSTNDAFRQYELQNKNYQLAFDRQIENMNVNNSIERTKAMAGAITGTVQGATTGAMTGAMVGGGYGAIAGAVVGGVTSAVGGAVDYNLLKQQQYEALDYTKDMFGFQLGNIKALPSTLNKVSSLTPVTKPFPFIEFYDCTEEEKEALRNKLKYNGMTIGVIGKIRDYLQADYSYIKGQLIRLEGTENDFHMVNAIAKELYEGVFIK